MGQVGDGLRARESARVRLPCARRRLPTGRQDLELSAASSLGERCGVPSFESPVAAARAADAAMRVQLGARVVGTYLHGSAALGGFVVGRSDTDVLIVVGDDVKEAELAGAAQMLRVNDGVAGAGIELSVVSASAAAHPAPPWPFLVHVATGPAGARTVWGSAHGGDADLLLHVAVARRAAVTVSGPPPVDVFGAVDRAAIVTALIDELVDATRRPDTTYAVLNACRAWRYAATGDLTSKLDGAAWVLARADAGRFHGTIRAAVDDQLGHAAEPPDPVTAASLVRHVVDRLDGSR